MRNFTPPQKIPDKLLLDPEISGYLNELNQSVYQLWYQSTGNKGITLISSTDGIDATQTGSTELYKVPSNKTFIPLWAVIRVISFTAGSKSTQAVASLGGNSATYNDFINSTTYTVTAQDTFQIGRPANATELVAQAADDSFRLIVETASDADTETWSVDLFGYQV